MPKTKLRAVAMIAVAGIIAGLSACGSGGGSGSPAATSTGSAGATRTVTDMAGRKVTIPADVTRVATNIPLIPPTIYLLGGISKLVYQTSSPPSAMFATIDPSIKKIPQAPVTTIDSEELLAQHPQVFIMTSLTQSLLPEVTRLGIPVVEIGNFSTPAELEHEVNLVAQVLGGSAPGRAAKFDSYYDQNVSMVQAKTGSLPASQRPSVYYAPGPTPTTTIGTGNIVTASINEAGGQNIAAVHGIGASAGSSFAFPTITQETLLSWNPDVIVGISATVSKGVTSAPGFNALNAVSGKRVYTCPTGVFEWCASSAESALQPLYFAKTLHSALFPDLNLVSAVKTFYSEFYSYHLSDQQADTILGI